jgi:hypothetical protein
MTDANYFRQNRIFNIERSQEVNPVYSPEDDSCNRSNLERVAPFTPLHDRSLVVLATEIEELKGHI